MSANTTPLLCPVNPGSEIVLTTNMKHGGRTTNVACAVRGRVAAIQPSLTWGWRAEIRGTDLNWTGFAYFREFQGYAVNQFRKVVW